MTTKQQQRIELPDYILDGIRSIARNTDMRSGDRLGAICVLIYGWAWFERQDEVDATSIALSEDQWKQIAEVVTESTPGDASDKANMAMTFVNYGPSAYSK